MKPTKYTVILLASLAGATHLMAIPDSPAILLPGISHLAGWSDFTVAKTAPDELMAGFSGVANTANTGYGIGSNYGNNEGVLGASDWELDDSAINGSPPPTFLRNGAVQMGTTGDMFALMNVNAPKTQLGWLLFDLQRDTAFPAVPGPKVEVKYATTGPSGVNTGTLAAGLEGFTTTPDYTDVNFNLAGLGLWLDVGDTITFTFKEINGGAVHLDNLGIAAIPEPGSLLAFGCFLGSGLLIRRNRRSIA